MVAGTKNTTTSIVGTTAAYASVNAFDIWQGRFLTDAGNEYDLREAVLGGTTADDLGLGASAIGSTITIDGLPFQVVGILQTKGSSGPTSQDDQVLIPLTTAQHHFVSGTSVRSISLSVATADQIDAVKASITTTLDERHGIGASGTPDFSITDQSQLLSTVDSVSGLLTVLLGGIASISLIVGGIGIMNIMLVSVRERTREIGIRKAIGARSRDILAQFLVEALRHLAAGRPHRHRRGRDRLGGHRPDRRLGLRLQSLDRRGGGRLQPGRRRRLRRLAGPPGGSS